MPDAYPIPEPRPRAAAFTSMPVHDMAPRAVATKTIYLGEGGGPLNNSVGKNAVEGSPDTPSLEIRDVGLWRFRWVVAAGDRTLSVRVKQPANVTPYPSVVLKKNTGVGLNADATFASAGGAGWVTITASFTASAAGAIWVELHNNARSASVLGVIRTPAYFDHIVVT